MLNYIALCLAFFIVVLPVSANEPALKELQQRCEDAREQKIAPLRDSAIKECVSKDRNSRDAREKCERFYVGYGEGARYKSGGHRERMFNDLPECLEYFEAERQHTSGNKYIERPLRSIINGS